MPVPSIDFYRYADDALPPNHRLTKFIIWIRSLMFTWWYRYQLFKRYMLSANDVSFYDSTATYVAGDLTKTILGVFVSRADSNTGNPVTNETYWYKVLDFFIGATERTKYNGRYLNLTYQLNRYFQGELSANGLVGFRQPPYPAPYDYGLGSGTFSDIYITSDPVVFRSFIMRPRGYLSTFMYPRTSAPYYMFNPPRYTPASSYRFTVHIPLAVFDALGSDDAIRESVVRKFVNKYNVSGTFYTVTTY